LYIFFVLRVKIKNGEAITLTMTTSGRRDVKRWIMSFGKEARLLEPGDLKREIEVELKEILGGA